MEIYNFQFKNTKCSVLVHENLNGFWKSKAQKSYKNVFFQTFTSNAGKFSKNYNRLINKEALSNSFQNQILLYGEFQNLLQTL